MLCYIISIESNGGSRINFGWLIELLAGILLAIILIIIYFIVIYKSFKKYENAEKDAGEIFLEIEVSYGLVSWDNIKEFMPVDETDDSIKIILYKRMNLGKKITLYCQPEDIMNVLHMIERKINVNPEIV